MSGSDHGIPTHLSILQSYLFSRAYPVRCSLFPVQSTLWLGTALYLISKTPHINPAASAMQTSGQINVNFLLALTCQEPQTEGCKQTGIGHSEQARHSKSGSSDTTASRLLGTWMHVVEWRSLCVRTWQKEFRGGWEWRATGGATQSEDWCWTRRARTLKVTVTQSVCDSHVDLFITGLKVP